MYVSVIISLIHYGGIFVKAERAMVPAILPFISMFYIDVAVLFIREKRIHITLLIYRSMNGWLLFIFTQ